MYFPYLRGKQFELIALREICDLLANNRTKVSPIIEPVKDSSTLKTTIVKLSSNDINFNIIVNPLVGDLIGKTGEILTFLASELSGYGNFQIAIILSNNVNHKTIITALKKHKNIIRGLTLIHQESIDNIEEVVNDFKSVFTIKYNVVYFSKTNRRYYRHFDVGTVVELDDFFSAQIKNADYKGLAESDFSEEHLFYKTEGFVGFSDFLTIGDNYSESGFLPYAIAIHLSYSDPSKKIKVRHFVSDSNDDTSDIAGKFAEALEKLIDWCNKTGFNTRAVKIFRALYESGHFPGLGSIKRLSVMNHIELVLGLI